MEVFGAREEAKYKDWLVEIVSSMKDLVGRYQQNKQKTISSSKKLKQKWGTASITLAE